MKINSYTKTGTKSEVNAPSAFAGKINNDLLMQAIHVYRARKHPGKSKVQTRSDVSLTKAKVYRQKGTGNARHGAKSAPIFVGGGSAHGPKGVKRVLSLPLKMRRKALESALAAKLSKKHIALADVAKLEKTADAQKLVDKIIAGEEIKRGNITIVLADTHKESKKAFSNIGRVKTQEYKDLNAYSVYFGGTLVFDTTLFDTKEAKKTVKK